MVYDNYIVEGTSAKKEENKPLTSEQLEGAKKVKSCVKKYGPEIVSSMNNDKDAISALEQAINKSGKKLEAKYVYSFKEESPDSISFYCVDKSIVDAIGNDEKEAISKPIRKVLFDISNKILDKIVKEAANVDFDKISVSDDMYAFDGGLVIEIYGN